MTSSNENQAITITLLLYDDTVNAATVNATTVNTANKVLKIKIEKSDADSLVTEADTSPDKWIIPDESNIIAALKRIPDIADFNTKFETYNNQLHIKIRKDIIHNIHAAGLKNKDQETIITNLINSISKESELNNILTNLKQMNIRTRVTSPLFSNASNAYSKITGYTGNDKQYIPLTDPELTKFLTTGKMTGGSKKHTQKRNKRTHNKKTVSNL